jgi:hypothetical protein
MACNYFSFSNLSAYGGKMTKKKMVNRNLFLFCMVFISCADLIPNEEDKTSIYVYINPRLPQDENGFFHLTLNRNKWQTIHRFSGLVTDEDDNPLDVVRFEWSSNLYWVLGDTLGYIIKRGLTDEMVYVNYDTIPITGFGGHIVPTINPACYSNSKGEFSQMSGFVRNMVGDTAEISITYGLREVSEETNQINFSVVLD